MLVYNVILFYSSNFVLIICICRLELLYNKIHYTNVSAMSVLVYIVKLFFKFVCPNRSPT